MRLNEGVADVFSNVLKILLHFTTVTMIIHQYTAISLPKCVLFLFLISSTKLPLPFLGVCQNQFNRALYYVNASYLMLMMWISSELQSMFLYPLFTLSSAATVALHQTDKMWLPKSPGHSSITISTVIPADFTAQKHGKRTKLLWKLKEFNSCNNWMRLISHSNLFYCNMILNLKILYIISRNHVHYFHDNNTEKSNKIHYL